MDTWGMLPKSQINPSTVDEEIAALVAVHEADPDAHLEVGESLQSHKASEIIDHIAKSIVEDKIDDLAISSRCITTDQIVGKDIRTAENVGVDVDGVSMLPSGIEMWQGGDKMVDIPVSGNPVFKGEVSVGALSYSKFTLFTNFESLDSFIKSPKVFGTFGYVEVPPNSSGDTVEYLQGSYEENSGVWPDITKNPIFETVCYIDPSDDFDSQFGFGSFDEDNGVGFRATESSFRAYWFDDSSVYHYATIDGVSIEQYNLYRIEVDYSVGIKWYVNGVLVISKTWAQIGSLTSFWFIWKFRAVRNTASTTKIIINSVLYQQNI
jgi:hypothetical protein